MLHNHFQGCMTIIVLKSVACFLQLLKTAACCLLQGLAPLVDVREVEQSILCLGGTVNYKHFYDPDGMDDSEDDDDPGDKGEAHSPGQSLFNNWRWRAVTATCCRTKLEAAYVAL
jgi:hypothetical protein